jgi:putative sugar O-methyltransferase
MADWVIRRPEWLRVKSASPSARLEPSSPFVGDNAVQIAERSILAFHRLASTGDDLIPTSSIWGDLRQAHYARLTALIERGDPSALAEYQSGLFRTEAVNGFTYGTTFDGWPHRWHYLPIQIELSVVQLAETIGVLRTECHEQGAIAFWRSLISEEQLVEQIEDFFGIRLEQPRFGDPHGIMFGGRFLTRETCSHLYTAHRIKNAIERQGFDQPLRIVEIGAGFGGTCYWLRRLLGRRAERYVIVDLPEVALVQAFFLGNTNPEALVLHGEDRPDSDGTIELIPHTALSDIDFRPNILINQDSMPEMPLSEVNRYLEWASANLDGLFFSFNQETLSSSHGSLQVWVAENVRRYGRFKLVSRDASWDRRGYVEEVYSTMDQQPAQR